MSAASKAVNTHVSSSLVTTKLYPDFLSGNNIVCGESGEAVETIATRGGTESLLLPVILI